MYWHTTFIVNHISTVFLNIEGLCFLRWHQKNSFWNTFSIPDGDVIKWKHFSPYWPFVGGFHQSPVDSPHRGQRRGTLIFSLMCLNKRLSKQPRSRWFETPPCSLWPHCNVNIGVLYFLRWHKKTHFRTHSVFLIIIKPYHKKIPKGFKSILPDCVMTWNTFRTTGPLIGESIDDLWISLQKGSLMWSFNFSFLLICIKLLTCSQFPCD